LFIELPFNDYFEYYGPDYTITVPPSNMANLNTTDYLDKLKVHILENLRHTPFAPSGPTLQSSPPDDLFDSDAERAADDDWQDFDYRYPEPSSVDHDDGGEIIEPFTANRPLHPPPIGSAESSGIAIQEASPALVEEDLPDLTATSENLQ
jgi:hypothetical protein